MSLLIFFFILMPFQVEASNNVCLLALSKAERKQMLVRAADLRRMREIEEMLGELVLETEHGDEYLGYQFSLKQTLVAELERLQAKYGNAHRDSDWTRKTKARLREMADETASDWHSVSERQATERYVAEKKEELAFLKPQLDALEAEALKMEKRRVHLDDMRRNLIREGLPLPQWLVVLYRGSRKLTQVEKEYGAARAQYNAILDDVLEHEDALRENEEVSE